MIPVGTKVCVKENMTLVGGRELRKGDEFVVHSVSGDLLRVATPLKPRAIKVLIHVSDVVILPPHDSKCVSIKLDDIDESSERDTIAEDSFGGSVGDVDSNDAGSAARFDNGKPMLHLVPMSLLADVARVFEFGAKKYKEWNWAKGGQYSRQLSCVLRHINKWFYEHEDIDEETGLHPIDHAIASLLILKQSINTYPEGDDRPTDFRTTSHGSSVSMDQ